MGDIPCRSLDASAAFPALARGVGREGAALAPPVAASGRGSGDARGWLAHLQLTFDAANGATRLAARRHTGPLVVQRALTPEGPAICHAIVVHPPGGIAGGDLLELDVAAGEGAHALLTTPGAGKLYRSGGRVAAQRVRLVAGERACIEWLPQETIVFDGAEAELALDIDVDPSARVLAWDIVTLGRAAMRERFARGRLHSRLALRSGGKLLLWEHGEVSGAAPWLDSPIGWAGRRACGTFVAAGPAIDDALVDACREAVAPWSTTAAVSRLAASLLVARYLGPDAASARAAFAALWSRLRPALTGHAARAPRIWAT